MKIYEIKENAIQALNKKWGKGACIVLGYVVFNLLISFMLKGLAAIIEVPISFGVAYVFIKLKRNEEVKIVDFFDLGFSNFVRAWKITLRIALKMILPLICIVISYVLTIFVVRMQHLMLMNTDSPETIFGIFRILRIIVVIVNIVSIFGMMWISLLYSLTSYIAYDNPNMTSLEVINESARMMNGSRGKIILLQLSFVGWAILAVFTLGIGYLWLAPYMQVSLVGFYESLLEENFDDKNVRDIHNAIN